MTTHERLLDYLTDVYDSSADPLLGLRLTYQTGQMQWRIAEDTLTTTVANGGPGASLSIDLSRYTLSSLATFLSAQPGYTVLYLDQTGSASLSALALVPGSGDIATSNGDHIYVAQNPNWTHLGALAAELELAATAIALMPQEMQTTTADGSWLDLLGSYYAVPRQLGEQDPQYSPRIPAEVILPRQNNVAIAAALEASSGQIATCTNAPVFGKPEPAFDGQIGFSGAPHFFNASAALILNLFDVSIGYDLLGGLSPTDYLVLIRRQVDRLRAAGTHLRNLTLTPSVMGDRFDPPTDSLVEIAVIRSLSGSGQSSNSGVATGIFPTQLTPLSFSSNTGLGALSTVIRLAGTGSSIDKVALALPPGTGSSADVGSANLATHTIIVLAGTGGSLDSAFGALGTDPSLHGVGLSANSSGYPAVPPSFSAGFSTGFAVGFAARGVTLQIGPQLGFGSSANHGSGVLSTAIRVTGTGASADSVTVALSTIIRIAASANQSQAAVGALATSIKPVGTSSSAGSATGALTTGDFSTDFSTDFAS